MEQDNQQFQNEILEIIKKQREELEIFKEKIRKTTQSKLVRADPFFPGDNDFTIGGQVVFLYPEIPVETAHQVLREIQPILQRHKVVKLNIDLRKKF